MTPPQHRVVVVGNGMVGSRVVDDLLARDRDGALAITVLGAEEYEPYNRVLLSEVVAGKAELAALTLPGAGSGADRVAVHRGAPAIGLDRDRRTVLTAHGVHPYDTLVLATGSTARVPELDGLTGEHLPAGAHALRTLDDAREIVAACANARRAVVIGAGVLGLEVACGLARRGIAVDVVHGGASLMDRQLDVAAGRVVEGTLADLGVRSWTQARTRRVVVDDGRVTGVELDSGTTLAADLLVLACGTDPEVGLARAAGLTVERGVVVGHDLTSPDDPRVVAIGDCAQPPEGGTGLIAQGWDQSRRLADRLTAPAPTATGVPARSARRGSVPHVRLGDPDRPSMALRLGIRVVTRPAAGPHPAPSAPLADVPPARPAPPAPAPGTDVVRLKAVGLEVVTMGVCGARRDHDPAHRTLALNDPASGRYVEVVVAGGYLVGATCVGAPDVGADLTATYSRRTPVPADPAHLLLRPVAQAPAPAATPTHMPDRTTVCTCNGVTKGDIVGSWREGARTVADVASATRATTGCGGCKDVVCGLVDWLASADPDQSSQPGGGARENNVTTGQPERHRAEIAPH
ncbi:FAD-dependent oxidoreductase [Oerskovia flava]|uniref:FAD-dependent oxidoreductase n=1 Tax=Oerskovia flava TaxID=2986422 RepID=UPI00223EDE0B|nr:FAD-dependent oxidoreductase [Oerskovia sp. JB1-3-2]